MYGSWIEELGGTARGDSLGAGLRRLGKLLALDAALLAAIAVSASIWQRELSGWLGEVLGASPSIARALVGASAGGLAAPFVLGILRVSQRIGVTLARSALPIIGSGQLDLSVAPRHALVMTLQLASVLLVGLPLLAVLQPFLPLGAGAVALTLTLLGAAFGFWRSTADLQGHVRAGTSAVLEALIPQARGDSLSSKTGARDVVRELLPGLGEPEVMRLASQSSACNRSLSELNLRGLTGATVLAISRDGVSITLPSAREVLRAGDLVALAGTREAVRAAKELLFAQPVSVESKA